MKTIRSFAEFGLERLLHAKNIDKPVMWTVITLTVLSWATDTYLQYRSLPVCPPASISAPAARR